MIYIKIDEKFMIWQIEIKIFVSEMFVPPLTCVSKMFVPLCVSEMFVPPLTCVLKIFVPRGQTKRDRLTHWLTDKAVYIYR